MPAKLIALLVAIAGRTCFALVSALGACRVVGAIDVDETRRVAAPLHRARNDRGKMRVVTLEKFDLAIECRHADTPMAHGHRLPQHDHLIEIQQRLMRGPDHRVSIDGNRTTLNERVELLSQPSQAFDHPVVSGAAIKNVTMRENVVDDRIWTYADPPGMNGAVRIAREAKLHSMAQPTRLVDGHGHAKHPAHLVNVIVRDTRLRNNGGSPELGPRR